jgi:hypothetical protein
VSFVEDMASNCCHQVGQRRKDGCHDQSIIPSFFCLWQLNNADVEPEIVDELFS